MSSAASRLMAPVFAATLIATLPFAASCSSGSKAASSSTQSATAAASATSAASSTATATPEATTPQATKNSGQLAACSLATNADVAASYDEQFGAGQASSPGGFGNCLFPPTGGAVDSVSFTIAQGLARDTFYTSNKAAYGGSDVTDLGDQAFVSDDGGAVGVEKGDTALLVHVVGFEKLSPDQLKAKQEAFAKLLVSRLP